MSLLIVLKKYLDRGLIATFCMLSITSILKLIGLSVKGINLTKGLPAPNSISFGV
jgi:hypothetical protein